MWIVISAICLLFNMSECMKNLPELQENIHDEQKKLNFLASPLEMKR